MSAPLPVSASQYKDAEKWIEDFYHLMGTLDLPKFTSTYLKEDVLFHFTNLPPMKGRESLFSVFGLLGGVCTSITHKVTDLKVLSDRIMAASTVDYAFINGEKCSMNAFAILHKSPEAGLFCLSRCQTLTANRRSKPANTSFMETSLLVIKYSEA
ncbi:hypothetical protein IW261DRAFT_1559637 [Armillaria novae-zelandiae]|uniref:SnoaL-like domain-containing protein n=1 Tax=Armillaria novae-zelandiae TaxID=153914 RepID=A0AA39PMF8_9AGAR|nr:hypothetical protein IW261DRAFT_1559637 [Armillaria novae-zelandiae]